MLKGRALRHRLAGKPLATEALLALGIQLADALDAVHARGIVYRDHKPADLFVTRRGQTQVLDFGPAKSLARRDEEPGHPEASLRFPG
jgi:serine/threonine protein kinase